MKPKTKAFADKLLANEKLSPTQAYLDTHMTNHRDTAHVESSRLLAKPSVRIYMKKHIQMAKSNIVLLAKDKNVKAETRLKANQDILDRSIGKAVQQVNTQNTNLNINIEASKELKDDFTEFLKAKTSSSKAL